MGKMIPLGSILCGQFREGLDSDDPGECGPNMTKNQTCACMDDLMKLRPLEWSQFLWGYSSIDWRLEEEVKYP